MVLFFSMYIAVFNWKHIFTYCLFRNKDILFIFTKAMKTHYSFFLLGDVVLKDLLIKESALDILDLPIRLEYGRLGL